MSASKLHRLWYFALILLVALCAELSGDDDNLSRTEWRNDLSILVGYSHWLAGSYMRQAGPETRHASVGFVQTQLTFWGERIGRTDRGRRFGRPAGG